jgi:hypothetical protein
MARTALQFRPIVSDKRKFLVSLRDELKEKNNQKVTNSMELSGERKRRAKGYSFGKKGVNN